MKELQEQIAGGKPLPKRGDLPAIDFKGGEKAMGAKPAKPEKKKLFPIDFRISEKAMAVKTKPSKAN